MKVPVLTVIPPVLNGADDILACLDNVRDQGCAGVEHLVVDGGSTDGTVEHVLLRMADDPSVRLLTGPDRGQSHAMNKGIVHASAPILGFLNVDDRYAPGALAAATEVLAGAPVPSFLWGACEVRNERQARVWVQAPGRFESWRLAGGWRFEPYPVNPASYFYHRELHERAGLYRESEHYALDAEFLLRAAAHCIKVYTDPTVLGHYNLAVATKTDEDMQRGTQGARLQAVYAEAVGRLSPGDRFRMVSFRIWRRARIQLKRGVSRWFL